MTRFEATLAVEPVPKGRPRFGSGHVYTPERTSQFETTVRWLLRQATLKQGLIIPVLAGDIGLHVTCWVGRMGSDFDNYLKAISDAANGIVWKDDRQVMDGRVTLVRTAAGISPHIDFTAWEMDMPEVAETRRRKAG